MGIEVKEDRSNLRYVAWCMLLVAGVLTAVLSGLMLAAEPDQDILGVLEKPNAPQPVSPWFSAAECRDTVLQFRPRAEKKLNPWESLSITPCFEAVGLSPENFTSDISAIPSEWSVKWAAKEETVRREVREAHRRAIWRWRTEWVILPVVGLFLGCIAALLGLRGVVRGFGRS